MSRLPAGCGVSRWGRVGIDRWSRWVRRVGGVGPEDNQRNGTVTGLSPAKTVTETRTETSPSPTITHHTTTVVTTPSSSTGGGVPWWVWVPVLGIAAVVIGIVWSGAAVQPRRGQTTAVPADPDRDPKCGAIREHSESAEQDRRHGQHRSQQNRVLAPGDRAELGGR